MMSRRALTFSTFTASAVVVAIAACSEKRSKEPRYVPASRTVPESELQRPTPPQSLGSSTDMGTRSDTDTSEAGAPSGPADTWGTGTGGSTTPGTNGDQAPAPDATGSTGDMNAATPGAGASTAPSAGVGEPSSFAVTRARCDREIRCKNVGAGKKYETREDCVRDLNRSDSDMFGSNVCANGVDQDSLNRCLNAIRNESCKTSLDKLDTLNACTPTKVCKK